MVGERLLTGFERGAHRQDEEECCPADVATESNTDDHDQELDRSAKGEGIDSAIFARVHQQLDGTAGESSVDDERDSTGDRERSEYDEQPAHCEKFGVTDQSQPDVDGDAVREHVEESADLWTSTEKCRDDKECAGEKPPGLTEADPELVAECGQHDVEGGYAEPSVDEQRDAQANGDRAGELAQDLTKSVSTLG